MAKVAKGVQVRRDNREDLTDDQVTELIDKSVQYKLSLAKLHLINTIIEADDTYTVVNLKDLSVRELYRILSVLAPDEDNDPGNNENPGNN